MGTAMRRFYYISGLIIQVRNHKKRGFTAGSLQKEGALLMRRAGVRRRVKLNEILCFLNIDY